jgi:hypothetical protein
MRPRWSQPQMSNNLAIVTIAGLLRFARKDG